LNKKKFFFYLIILKNWDPLFARTTPVKRPAREGHPPETPPPPPPLRQNCGTHLPGAFVRTAEFIFEYVYWKDTRHMLNKRLLSLQTVQTGCWPKPAPYAMGNGVL